MSFSVSFDENNQEIVLAGVMRPKVAEELAAWRGLIEQVIIRVSGTLFFNFKKLEKVNNVAFHELAGILTFACNEQPELKIRIVVSSVVGWATRKFRVIGSISPNIQIEEYDNDFYPGQGVLEDGAFVPVLR